jgi:predicted RNase H-like HicB family nuclease
MATAQEYYIEHYSVSIVWDRERQQYLATATEYSITMHGETHIEALSNLQKVMEIVLHAIITGANLPPIPIAYEED